jgi:aspartate aminotransferase-like enzyme
VILDQFGLSLGEGSAKLSKTVFRIGHMGYCSPLDVLQYISALEIALDLLQVDVKLGSGTAAAQKVYKAYYENHR